MYGVYSTVSAKPIYCMHNFCFSAMSHTRMHMQTRQRGWRFEYLEGKSEQGLGHNTHTHTHEGAGGLNTWNWVQEQDGTRGHKW